MSTIIFGDPISKSPLNHSYSKQMYSFPKDQRFRMKKPNRNDTFYNLPDEKSHRATSIGFGTKYDFTKEHKDKSQTFYNIAKDFDPKKSNAPAYTFGIARSFYDKVYCDANKMLDKNVPGPGLYTITRPFGYEASKYTMVGKGEDLQRKKAKNDPGPGQYKIVQMNKEGIYPLSRFRNTAGITFGVSKEKRFSYNSKDKFPAPNKYNINNLITGKGFIFSSKFKSSAASSITGKGKDLSTKYTNYISNDFI